MPTCSGVFVFVPDSGAGSAVSVDQFVGLRITGGLLPADLPSQLSVGHDPSGKVLSPRTITW